MVVHGRRLGLTISNWGGRDNPMMIENVQTCISFTSCSSSCPIPVYAPSPRDCRPGLSDGSERSYRSHNAVSLSSQIPVFDMVSAISPYFIAASRER
jgi:hypothetical protein